jgi:hypothetical protein
MKLINFFNIYSCLNESLPTEIAASSSDYSRKRITEKEREIERERERERERKRGGTSEFGARKHRN